MPNPVLREEVMPTYAPSQYRWSEQTQNYVLSIGETIRQEALSGEWLEQITSFAFHSRSGMHFTARKQKVQRGTNYWYGYRRLHGRLLKHYLGKTSDLTLARLEEVARLLENESGQKRISPLLPEEIAPSQSSVHIPTPAGDPHVLSVTAQPLLLSKLLPPRLPQFLLGRPRLFALLDAGWRGCLTLLSAPAGFVHCLKRICLNQSSETAHFRCVQKDCCSTSSAFKAFFLTRNP